MDIEDEIRKLIFADARTQKEIAAAAGMHDISLNRFLKRKRRIGLEVAQSLARVLGAEIIVKQNRRKK